MFKKRVHVGRPSHIELRNKRIKRLCLGLLPVVIIIIGIILINPKFFSSLMGNSVLEYTCFDDSYELSGKNCIKRIEINANVLGDVNKDNKISIADVSLLQKVIVDGDIDDYMYIGDVNFDNFINDQDINILQYYLNQTHNNTVLGYDNYGIGTKLVCPKDYSLNNNLCVKEEKIPATLKEQKNTDNSVGSETESQVIAKTFIIKYDANGGIGKMDDQEIIYGNSTNLFENKFEKDGYKANGWIVKNSSNKWGCYKNSDKTDKGYTDESYCQKYGYVVYKDGQAVSQTVPVGQTVTFYANWQKINYYTIIYDANGGSGKMANQEIVYGNSTNLLKNKFEKKGYEANGWIVKNSSNKWGCYKNSDKTDKGYTDESYCQKYGYVVYKDGQAVSQTVPVGQTVTFYANWQKINYYTIIYDANGGSGKMANQKIVYGQKTKLLTNNFTKTGSKFTGWRVKKSNNEWACYKNEQQDSQGFTSKSNCEKYGYVMYADETSVAKTASIGETITFVAQWTKLKIIDTIQSSDLNKDLRVAGNGVSYIAQSFCISGNYYMTAQIDGNDTKTYIQVFDRTSKNKVNSFVTNLSHANGMAKNKNKNNVLVVHANGKKYSIISTKTINTDNQIKKTDNNFSRDISGAAYDENTNQYYFAKGSQLFVYDYNFNLVRTIKKIRTETPQDIGAYNGVIMVIVYNSSANTNNAIDLYRASDGTYLGTYNLPFYQMELESVEYAGNGEFALYYYSNNEKVGYIYKTKKLKI